MNGVVMGEEYQACLGKTRETEETGENRHGCVCVRENIIVQLQVGVRYIKIKQKKNFNSTKQS